MSDSILTRAIKVVDAVSVSRDGLRHKDIKSLLGAPSPATVSKILKELLAADVLSKTPQGTYVVGMKAYFWGKTAVTRRGPLQVIREEMERLHERFHASVNLFTRSGKSMLCLEGFMSEHSTVLWPPGKSLPLSLSVIGGMFLLEPERMQDDAFLEAQCAAHMPRLDPKRVRAMYKESMDTGIMSDPGLFYPGILRVAVPLREQGEVSMVLGVGVLQSQHEDENILDTLGTALREAAGRIEEQIQA